MSELNDLITKLCPDGVPYKKLNEVLNYEQPSKYLVSSKNYSDEYSTPVLTAGKTFILGYTDEINGIYQASKDNPVIIFDDFTTDFKWVDFPFKAKSSGMKMLTPIDSNMCCFRYVYYAMSVINFVPSEHKRHWISQYSNFAIPLPPLPVQEEVVRILDSFTELEAELEAELADRKEQYEYYLDYLLDKKNLEKIDGTAIETKRLDEVFDLKNGYTPSKQNAEYWKNGNVNWFRMEDIRANGRILSDSIQKVSMDGIKGGKLFEADSLIVSTSATIGEHALITVPFMCNQRFVCLTRKPDYKSLLDMKFMFYYASKLDKYCLKNINQGGFASVSMPAFKEFSVPLPSLATQKRVVDILDRFDALTTSLTDGIPAEIAMRREQYEYYRSRLLDFPHLLDGSASVSDSE